MKSDSKLIRPFRAILAEEGLLDLAPFNERGFFDEIPLYSRTSQVDFLNTTLGNNASDIDLAILNFAVDYLDLLHQECRPKSSFLAALTFVKPAEDEPIVPSIFVCHGDVEERIQDKLILDKPKSIPARLVKKLLGRSQAGKRYEVLEDARTIAPDVRVFLGSRSPSNLYMATIGELKAELSPDRKSVR